MAPDRVQAVEGLVEIVEGGLERIRIVGLHKRTTDGHVIHGGGGKTRRLDDAVDLGRGLEGVDCEALHLCDLFTLDGFERQGDGREYPVCPFADGFFGSGVRGRRVGERIDVQAGRVGKNLGLSGERGQALGLD